MNNEDVAVLILSCDNYSDIWGPFFTLFNKYWNCPYKVYISTESKRCEYAESILVNTLIWTDRIRETLKQINTKYVLIMCEDYFLIDNADQKRIDYCLNNFDENTATFNFEKSFMNGDYDSDKEGFKLRPDNSKFMLSCQAGIWNKEKLIKLLDCQLNPWEWEEQVIASEDKFYINSGEYIINYGYKYGSWFGIRKGKWCKETLDLFAKEGLDVDFNERGIYNEGIDNNSGL